MQDRLSEKVQTSVDGVTATGLMSSPLWIDLTNALHIAGLIIGCLVGLTSLYINWQKIKKNKEKNKKG